jgi:hypothetical protein
MTQLELVKRLHVIQHRLLDIKQLLEIHDLEGADMAVSKAVQDILDAVDAATNAIAARIQALVDASGLNADEKAAFAAEVTKLTALGKSDIVQP